MSDELTTCDELLELPERDRLGVRGLIDRMTHERQEREAMRETLRERLITHASMQMGYARTVRRMGGPVPDVGERCADAAWATVLALLLGVLLVLAPARAAAHPDEVLLGRTCWSESGRWDRDGAFTRVDDCAAIADVLRGLAAREGVTFARAWALASPRLARGTVSRAWLADLDEDAHRPVGFPMAWASRWRGRWLGLVELARRILAGEVTSSCAEPPRTWGSHADVLAGMRRGRARWVEVECGDTANRFGRWEAR